MTTSLFASKIPCLQFDTYDNILNKFVTYVTILRRINEQTHRCLKRVFSLFELFKISKFIELIAIR